MNGTDEYALARQQMVDTQIAQRGIVDPPVLRAMETVLRHLFVERRLWGQAYEDHPLPIGFGQTISQPYIVAYMTDALGVAPGMKVLEIGTGCGYQSAILCELGALVYSMEIVPSLAAKAKERLPSMGYEPKIKVADGHGGWDNEAPFERMIVAAAPAAIPPALVDQLAESGRMVIPVGDHVQNLLVLEKQNGQLVELQSLAVRFVPLVHPD